MTDFQANLDRHVAALTQAILDSILKHSLNEIMGGAEDAPVALADVVAHLEAHQSGLRSEQIRAALGIEKHQVQRLLEEGLATNALVKSGERRATLYFARAPRGNAAAAPAPSEAETSILEHLNEAGPKGSNLKAWIISTHGELEGEEHAAREREGREAFDALVERGAVTSWNGGPARGTVYALAPSA